jgi:hypothetical protein
MHYYVLSVGSRIAADVFVGSVDVFLAPVLLVSRLLLPPPASRSLSSQGWRRRFVKARKIKYKKCGKFNFVSPGRNGELIKTRGRTYMV